MGGTDVHNTEEMIQSKGSATKMIWKSKLMNQWKKQGATELNSSTSLKTGRTNRLKDNRLQQRLRIQKIKVSLLAFDYDKHSLA